MKRILVDVDTQFDFVDPAGALFVPAPEATRRALETCLTEAERDGVPIVGSVDSHAWDAWEFATQGGPFPAHCVKGTPGWLRIVPHRPARTRFVPMQELHGGGVRNVVGERVPGGGVRIFDADALAEEAYRGVGIYFEKEVYSLFSNAAAAPVLERLVARMGGADEVAFDVLGYCTGGYCVDAAVEGLRDRGYRVRVLAFATAPIGGEQGAARSRAACEARGAAWIDTPSS